MGFELLWILLVVSAVLCAVGFYRFVYFLSIGYGFAVAGIGITLFIMSLTGDLQTGVPQYVQFALFVIYGLRLSLFLLVRELRNTIYRKTLNEATGNEKKMPLFVKATIWICVSILYVAQTSPVFFRLYNNVEKSAIVWVGVAISIIGLFIETLADLQKDRQKKARPDMVATKGLYRIVRCPNYFGEILFWTGIFISGVCALQGVGQWLTAVLGYICIVYIMFNGAQRLEKRQMKRYQNNDEYQNYANHTPIILPLIPLFHLVKKEK